MDDLIGVFNRLEIHDNRSKSNKDVDALTASFKALSMATNDNIEDLTNSISSLSIKSTSSISNLIKSIEKLELTDDHIKIQLVSQQIIIIRNKRCGLDVGFKFNQIWLF